MGKAFRMRLKSSAPLVVISLFYALSLLIRFTYQLYGMPLRGGLGFLEGINEIVKTALSIGIAWLILRGTAVPISKKEFPGMDVAIGLLSVGAVAFSSYYVPMLIGDYGLALLIKNMSFVVPVIIPVRHYGWKGLRLFVKDLGLSIPTIRMTTTWVVTLLASFSLILVNGGKNGLTYLQQLVWTYGLREGSFVYRILIYFLPEELFFRVYLQTRLEKLMSTWWAILAQSLLTSLAYIFMIPGVLGWPPGLFPLAFIAEKILVTNTLIGGYLWHKTRNLPVLALYHWSIYPLLPLIFLPSYYLW